MFFVKLETSLEACSKVVFIWKTFFRCFPAFPLNRGEKYYFLTFIYEMFPRLGEIYFFGLCGWKILQETNLQKGLTKT